MGIRMKRKIRPAKFTTHRYVDGPDVRAICDADHAAYASLVKLVAREVRNDLARALRKIQEPVNFREGTSRPASEE